MWVVWMIVLQLIVSLVFACVIYLIWRAANHGQKW